ncbi:MAG TPA: MASE1 domain-containing protein [Verrucomicrobiae bacterium]|nr:MASE1 domain-containing protein [Verrucomicrobiae bacterium]
MIHPPGSRLSRLAILIGVTVIYFAAGRLGLSFALINSSATSIWPPTGIALGVLLLLGPRAWPAIFVGAFLVNFATAGSLWTSLGIAAGNTAEALLGTWLIQRYATGTECFNRAGDIFKFALLGAGVATTVSATVGVATLVAGGLADSTQFGAIWLTWWLGDASGALIVTPLVVLWYRTLASNAPTTERRTEALLVYLVVAAIGLLVFMWSSHPLVFLCLAPLSWAAFRLSQREVATAIGLLAVIACWATVHETGPFAVSSPHGSLLILQAFMGTLALTMLPMTALVAENRAAVKAAAAGAAELASAIRAKDEFLAMLSHEFRNPLHAISNAAALLQRPTQPGKPQAEQALQILQRQTEHLSRLVEDLLDVTRAMAGRLSMESRPVDLEVTIQQVLDELTAAGRRQHHIVTAYSDPIWALGDPVRLHQVFMNLLENALKYTPSGGTIRILGARDGGEAVINIEDSGIGIAPDLLPRIFEPFTQGERKLDRREGGLGIGLTLARKFIEKQGGRLEAFSEGVGHGAVFTIRLPQAEPPAQSALARSRPATTHSRRILIIEDNEDARRSLCVLLQAVGHEVHEAEDGRSGIEKALRIQPDVTLVDIGLPEIDGYEVARQLKSRAATGKVVALTGYGRPEDRQRATEAGFDEHLVKPATLEQLQRSIGG